MKAIFLTGVISILMAPACPALGADAAAQASLTPGKVVAVIVEGDVQRVDATGNRKPLAKFDIFGEGETIVTGPQSDATLTFSNGVVMILKQNAQLNVTKFEQAPFHPFTDGTYMRLKRDPSKSVTELDLRNGTAEFEVKPLDVDAGSTFAVHTPAGSFGVRGTMFVIAVSRDKNGGVSQVLGSTLLGTVVCTPAPALMNGSTPAVLGPPNNNIAIPAGGQIQITQAGDGSGLKLAGAGLPPKAAWHFIAEIYWAFTWARTENPFARMTPDAAPATPPAGLPQADPLPIDPTGPSE